MNALLKQVSFVSGLHGSKLTGLTGAINEKNHMKKEHKDAIFANPLDKVATFSFDDQVVQVFPDMIKRSVPGYSNMIGMTGVIAKRYWQPGTRIYDLGCSLGASTLSVCHQISDPSLEIVALDNSQAMIERCQQVFAQEALTETGEPRHIHLACADINDSPIENASVVILNFTFQFLPLETRLPLLKRIMAGLAPGGVLVLSEKVRFDEHEQQDTLFDLHLDFKRANGYSELEISQKRAALENFLQAESFATHQQRFAEAGFAESCVWFQYLNFASMLAIKAR
ncbi:tRNA (cmo5U34)-methyltransferase [Oceanospirillum multiglobuliferum]|nr:tRNA (cmo5U34)-methyltransferase [Oceanospirillum multiglobuliferum]